MPRRAGERYLAEERAEFSVCSSSMARYHYRF
jgi:hypothetical protein